MSKKYFQNLQKTIYDGKVAINILGKSIPVREIVNNTSLYYKYTIEGWDTPENLAAKLYDNSNYHWVILLLNNVIDPFYDWILREEEVFKYATEIYGNDLRSVHHYENEDGWLIGCSNESKTNKLDCISGGFEWYDDSITTVENNPLITPITNLEWEQRINDRKREIKVLRPEYVNTFVTQFTEIMK